MLPPPTIHLTSKRSHYLIILCCFFLPALSFALSVSSTKSTTSINTNQSSDINDMKILCVGICSLDTLATLNEFPTPDAKLRSTSLIHSGGGNAANTAVAISRLSHNISFLKELQVQVDLLSAVGNDSNGDTIISGLEAEHVGTKFIERFDGNSPWSYIMIVDDTRTIIHQPSTRDLSIDYVQEKLLNEHYLLNKYKAVHFDLRHPEASIIIAKECKKLNIPYSVDVERPRNGLLEILSCATLVICNANYVDLVLHDVSEEKKIYSDEEIVNRFKKVLSEQAPCAKIGIMTLGSRGSVLVNLDVDLSCDDVPNLVTRGEDKDDENLPSVVLKYGALWCGSFQQSNVVDTTGAGDAFQGGFLSTIWGYSMLINKQKYHQEINGHKSLIIPNNIKILSHALRIATRVAAKKIEQSGAREGLPRNDSFIESELEAMIND